MNARECGGSQATTDTEPRTRRRRRQMVMRTMVMRTRVTLMMSIHTRWCFAAAVLLTLRCRAVSAAFANHHPQQSYYHVDQTRHPNREGVGSPSTVLMMLRRLKARSQSNAAVSKQDFVETKRGGGSLAAVDAGVVLPLPDEDAESLAKRKRRERGMTLALASSYFTVMGAKCALPAVLALLTSPVTGLTFPSDAVPQQLVARQLTIATLAVAMGKLLLGPLIDSVGGIRSLQIALSTLAALLLTISLCQSFAVFSASWILVDFIFSSCWAACMNAIHQSFQKSDWPGQIGSLAAAARAGNSLAFIFFASILHVYENRGMRQYWRPVFLVAAAAQVIPMFLLSMFGREAMTTSGTNVSNKDANICETKAGNRSKYSSFRATLAILRREAATPDFWLHLINRSALMLFASFLLFVPTLMTEVYRTSSSVGAQVGSLYALGCLLSVTTASQLFSRLRRHAKLWAVTLFLLVGATGSSLAQLGHVSGFLRLTPWTSAILLFVWGFSFAIPFYIPASLYALSRGGQESSATIADVFDVAGFGLLALFNGYVASIVPSKPEAWIPTFVITTCCSLVSFAALLAAVLREEKYTAII